MTAPEVRASEMTIVDKSILKAMYEASEQDLTYGIGLIGVEGAALTGMMEHVQPDLRDGEGTDREETLGLSSV